MLSNLEEQKRFFDTYIWDGGEGGYMHHDLTAAIDDNLNFLVALALITYTEFIGGLLPPLPGEEQYCKTGNRKKFIRCFYRMDPWYEKFDKLLETDQGKDVYEIYRNGLAHQYLIKSHLGVGKVASIISKSANLQSGDSGFGVGVTTDGRLGFSISEYFRDFKGVLSVMREKLFVEKDPTWIESFEIWRGECKPSEELQQENFSEGHKNIP